MKLKYGETMKLVLQRWPTNQGATVGQLRLHDDHGGQHICYTVEDQIRPAGEPIVRQHTCIPPGHYRIIITPSPAFQRRLPLLLDVPDFTGIRIHIGNSKEDTHGCPLVGEIPTETTVLNSAKVFHPLFAMLDAHLMLGGWDPGAMDNPNEIWVQVRNPQEVMPVRPGNGRLA